MTTPRRIPNFEWWLLLVMVVYLVATMIYKGTVRGSGIYPSQALVYLTMVYQLAMGIGLFHLHGTLRAGLPATDTRRSHVTWLVVVGLIAVALLLLFRFIGTDYYGSWFTGHLRPFKMGG